MRVTFLFPKHPTPRSSDVRLGDVLIELDGKRDQKNTRQLHSHLQMNRDYGDRVPITVLRKDVEKELVLQLRGKRPEQ
ncbi:MAG: PDZ domain-containing protein [Planctomycetaceae bacterium]|nr:PDZ domain-containing protein [Planctomycetaceae bacterium]